MNLTSEQQNFVNDNFHEGMLQSELDESKFNQLKTSEELQFGNDIEIWDPIAYRHGISEIINQEVYDIHPKYRMVPFAKNLQDFIFRQLLESLTEMDEYSMFEGDSEAEIKIHLQNQLNTHRKYLTPKQIEILEDIYRRDIIEYTYKTSNGGEFEAEGLLTFDELEKIINKEIAFEKLNQKFAYIE